MTGDFKLLIRPMVFERVGPMSIMPGIFYVANPALEALQIRIGSL